MKRLPTMPRISLLLSGFLMTACATESVRDEVPDSVIQHSLSTLTSEESFSWEHSPGRIFVIRPLGTFKSGDSYCRDYEIRLEGFRGRPLKQTACLFDDRWTKVDPSKLNL